MTAGPAGPRRAVLAALALAAGCGAGTAAGRPGAPGAAPLVSVDGGTVTVALPSVPTTLNPHTVAGADAVTQAVGQLVWPQVFRVSAGATPVSAPLVDSAEVVNLLPQTVVYQIDPRAQWSDGAPVDAQDFVYAWLSQSGTGHDVDGAADSVASSYGYDDIASVVGSNGGKTVTVVFQKPYADWESLFESLLPAHVAERVGWNGGFSRFDPTALISGGPWMVSAWTPGRRMTLVHNPRWWGQAPRLDKLVLTAAPDAPAMVQALRDGEAQVAAPAGFDTGFEAAVSSSPTIGSAMQLGTTMLQLVFNTRRPPLDNALVRQGIGHVLDRAQLVTGLVQPLDPLAWEDNNHLFANVQAPYGDDAAGYTQPDPVTAARDLAAGGLGPTSTGAWTSHGAPVQLDLAWASDDPWSALVAPAIAAELVAAGFGVTSDPVPAATLEGSVLPAGGFDLALAPVQATAYPSHLASVFGAGSAPGGAYRNWSGFDDPRIDALFAQASEQLGATQEAQYFRQVDVALWAALPTLPLFAEPRVEAWSTSLVGVKSIPGALGPLWSAGSWAKLVPLAPRGVSASRQGRRSPTGGANRSR